MGSNQSHKPELIIHEPDDINITHKGFIDLVFKHGTVHVSSEDGYSRTNPI